MLDELCALYGAVQNNAASSAANQPIPRFAKLPQMSKAGRCDAITQSPGVSQTATPSKHPQPDQAALIGTPEPASRFFTSPSGQRYVLGHCATLAFGTIRPLFAALSFMCEGLIIFVRASFLGRFDSGNSMFSSIVVASIALDSG
ncbi:hypothetical protein BD410DRAFT_781935 [Rickenella mellea]|uniref:Uncharacterized protein n=1 Tax=Rickenella mellea TaxID=50990 RepID=A0A4Y7QKQ6_9AGAM|nr:hypothetical protein BD410DRAFT_781935 [Rickenella mellea]